MNLLSIICQYGPVQSPEEIVQYVHAHSEAASEQALQNMYPLFVFIGIVVFVMIVCVIYADKFGGGRWLVYNIAKNNGPNDPFTIMALKRVVKRILKREGYGEVDDLVLGYEVGGRYEGSFRQKNGTWFHHITIITDSYVVDYSIDGQPFRNFTG